MRGASRITAIKVWFCGAEGNNPLEPSLERKYNWILGYSPVISKNKLQNKYTIHCLQNILHLSTLTRSNAGASDTMSHIVCNYTTLTNTVCGWHFVIFTTTVLWSEDLLFRKLLQYGFRLLRPLRRQYNPIYNQYKDYSIQQH